MTTTFKVTKDRIKVTINPELEGALELSLNAEAALEWRDHLDRCLGELGQARWATAAKKRTRKKPP